MDYITKERGDKTVRIDTPQGNRVWLAKADEGDHLLVHTSVRLAGHMMLVDDLNGLPYVTAVRVTNHQNHAETGVCSTVELAPHSPNAFTMLVNDLPDLYEREFHERQLAEMAQKGGRP